MKRFNANNALRNDEEYYGPLAKVLDYIFYEIIYRPIADIINSEITDKWYGVEAPKVVKERDEQHDDNIREEIRRNKETILPVPLTTNAKEKSALIKAILSGRVQYHANRFEGSFNSSISAEIRKIGGKWDPRYKNWYMPKSKLPYDVIIAVADADSKLKRTGQRIDAHLQNLQRLMEKDPRFNLNKYFNETIKKFNIKFEKGIEGITVAPELTDEMILSLSEMYTTNMNLYIKNWTQESIIRLRKRIQKNAFEGYRASSFVKEIERDFQVSHAKAKFLARQETSLLMSQFREERYMSIGVQKYRWSTSGDQRVRPYHKRLNGKIFTWDNPPIVDEYGHRAHPGQDFGCRCIAIPIID